MLEGRVVFHEVSGDMSLLSPAPEASTSLLHGPSSTSRCQQVSYLPIFLSQASSFCSWGHCQSHICRPGQSLVKTIALCEETCFYLKSGCGHLWGHWKTYCAGFFISWSLLSDLLRTPVSAEAEVFVCWLLVRDVGSFSGCHFAFLLWDYRG